jgi:hypothetical protein
VNRTFITAFVVLWMVLTGVAGLVFGRPVHGMLLGALVAFVIIVASIAVNALLGTKFFKDK